MNEEQIQNMCNNFIIINDSFRKTKDEEHLKLDAKLELLEVVKKEVEEQRKIYEKKVQEWQDYSWKKCIAIQLSKVLLEEFNCEVIETFGGVFQLTMRVRELATNKIYSMTLEARFKDNGMSLLYDTGKRTNEFGKDTLGASLGMNSVLEPFTELTRHNFNEILHECPKEIQEQYKINA